jgi:hypothetical protein
MKITRQTTPTPQKRRRALRAGVMASRLRGNDGGCFGVKRYIIDSCLSSKYAGYCHICRVKTAKEAKDGPASFKGYVYDDKSRPLANVKVSIGRTASVSTTDANGLFQLDNIPPGRIDLFVDGRTVNPITAGNPQTAGNLQANDAAKPQYPSLHFEAYAIKGRDNQIAHPIYLPPLSTSPESVKTVGGSEDVILKIPGLAGFQMKVKANSVTFPDGSRVGTLVVSPVTADKLPMAPPAGGAQFGVPAWTVQPAGTRFDPPIEVTLPNASSQPAGDNLPIVQWDHDLGQYVAMGRATVSEDGSVLITDSGSGITKAGWGGLCRYDPDKCGQNHAPVCKECESLFTGSGDCPTCYFDPDKKIQKDTGAPKFIDIDASSSGIGKFLSDWIQKLPVHSAFTKQKFKIAGSRSPKEKCCAEVKGMAPFDSFQVGPSIEIATPDLPIPGYSIYFPPVLEVGLFTKLKVQVGGNVSFDYGKQCKPNVSNSSGQLVVSGSVEGILKIETIGAKLNAVVVGGGVGATCPVTFDSITCKGKLYIFAKSEVEFFNIKYGSLDFYKSTDANGSFSVLSMVD